MGSRSIGICSCRCSYCMLDAASHARRVWYLHGASDAKYLCGTSDAEFFSPWESATHLAACRCPCRPGAGLARNANSRLCRPSHGRLQTMRLLPHERMRQRNSVFLLSPVSSRREETPTAGERCSSQRNETSWIHARGLRKRCCWHVAYHNSVDAVGSALYGRMHAQSCMVFDIEHCLRC